jgi:hypothetical protein
MATKKAEKKAAAPPKAAPKYDDGPIRAELAGVKEAIRRLASGAVVTEEHRNELLDLLGGK